MMNISRTLLLAALVALGASSSPLVLQQLAFAQPRSGAEQTGAAAEIQAGSRRVGFSFALGSAATTSAGVYRGDTLVKTLWSNRLHDAGSHAAFWDGTTDEGGVAESGPYTIKVLSNNVRYTWEGVIGNTSESYTGPTTFHAEDIVHGMAVTKKAIYMATGYTEGRASTFKVDIDNPQAKANVLPTTFHYTGAVTYFVASDGNYVYWGANDAHNPSNYFIYATHTSDDSEVVFPRGLAIALNQGGKEKGWKYKSVIDQIDRAGSSITGLAVQKTGGHLFVSHGALGLVDVLDKVTGELIQSVPIPSPQALAIDGDDRLWISLTEEGKPVIRKYAVSAGGSLSPVERASIAGLVKPLAIVVSPDSATLLVADGGASQQLKAFDARTAAAGWTYGEPGGYANGPAVSDDKFLFHNFNPITFHGGSDRTFLAFEPDGSFWVGDSGNDRAQHYAADRSFIERIMWIPLFYSAFADPNNPTRVFANMLEFKIDYAKPLGPNNGSWTLVKNWGYDIPADYNDQYDLLRNVVTLGNGRTYAQMRSISKGKFQLVELLPESGLRFTGVETPNLGHGLYRDGSLRPTAPVLAGKPLAWSKRDLTGFDQSNNPQWGPLRTVAIGPPPAAGGPAPYFHLFTTAWDITSSGVLVAFDVRVPRTAFAKDPLTHDGWHLGGIDGATGAWRWKAAPSTSRTYHGDWPRDGAFDIGNYVVAAGSDAHVFDRNIFWQHYGEGWKGGDAGEVNMWTHVWDNGLMIGQFGAVMRTIGGQEDEGQPGMAGNAFCNTLVQGPNGVLYAFQNDEGFHGGVHRWRIDNLESIVERSIPVVWDASRYRRVDDPYDLLAGLPWGEEVADGKALWRRTPAQPISNDFARDWWKVITSVKTYRKDSPDIDISFVGSGSAAAIRELPFKGALARGWGIEGVMSWSMENHYESDQNGGGIYFEVLDGADRVIARLAPKRHPRQSDYFQFTSNDQAIFDSHSGETFRRKISTPHPFAIKASDGRLAFTYDTNPAVTVGVFDPQSDWTRPKRIRIYCWSGAGSRYRRAINIETLRFTPKPG